MCIADKEYTDFLESKRLVNIPTGFEPTGKINQTLFDFQRDIVLWALKKGKAAIFLGTGTGKTFIQLEWSHHVHEYTGGDILILAPLAVAQQTVNEGEKLGIEVTLCRSQDDVKPGINITNYEMLHRFDTSKFVGVVLDESSILKSFSGKIRTELIQKFKNTRFKLACTATPAPNDHIELTNHSDFLGVMKGSEVLAMFFTHGVDGIGDWTLKGHAKEAFWKWVSTWAVMLRNPADIGYDGSAFELPALNIHEYVADRTGYIVREASTLQQRRKARHDTITNRVECAAKIANTDDEPCIIWCDLNAESEALTRAIAGAVEIRGSHDSEYKTDAMLKFGSGAIKKLVTKPSIAGFGLNWQHCSKMIFVGLSDSFEQYYQAVRRCWRFGQKKPVDVYIITSEKEGAVVKNIKRKEQEFEDMLKGMISATQELTIQNLNHAESEQEDYSILHESTDLWDIWRGDNTELIKNVESDSLHYILFSPPFIQLFVYSNSFRDMGNCRDDEEFYTHMRFLSTELFRTLKPGRLMSVHCTQIPTAKSREGYISLKDFRGDLIRLFQDSGFILHSEVVIWKDPVQEMYRTKSLGLLHKQLKKDSAMSRQGRADYLLTFQKPGINLEPITHTDEQIPVPLWQRLASPVWMDINQMDVLNNGRGACEEEDEKHICPLQLEVIRRALELWTNPGDLVLDPFAGIGSTGYEAVKNGRRFLGFELKKSYYEQAVKNLKAAQAELSKPKQTSWERFQETEEMGG